MQFHHLRQRDAVTLLGHAALGWSLAAHAATAGYTAIDACTGARSVCRASADVGHQIASRLQEIAAIPPDREMNSAAANPATPLLSLRWTFSAKRSGLLRNRSGASQRGDLPQMRDCSVCARRVGEELERQILIAAGRR
jgi:hypothetical protein